MLASYHISITRQEDIPHTDRNREAMAAKCECKKIGNISSYISIK